MIAAAARRGRRFLIPEVIQTSSMDCGVASLKALAGGFGIDVNYGRLREACQTDVDGTSIDVIEELTSSLGLDAKQIIVPADHLLLASARALPGIAIVRLPNGFTHFVVVWRRHGRLVQVMDPARGRRWRHADGLLRELYVHRARVPATAWHTWASTRDFLDPLEERMRTLGVRRAQPLLDRALADQSGVRIAHLDAAVRMTTRLRQAGAIGTRRGAERLLDALLAEAPRPSRDGTGSIPDRHWFATPLETPEAGGSVAIAGAVIVRVPEHRAAASRATVGPGVSTDRADLAALVASLTEPAPRPAAELKRLLRADAHAIAPIVTVLALAAAGVVVEALFLRSLLDVGRDLTVAHQRLLVFGALTTFLALLIGVDLTAGAAFVRLGRRLEARVRTSFLRKLPRVADKYLQSRLVSDMAERCHSMYALRQFPAAAGQGVRLTMELLLTAAAIAWLDPTGWPAIAAAVLICLALPFGIQRVLLERDLRVRNLAGALSRFYLDTLRGLFAVRTHGAEQAIRREHEGLLVEWVRAAAALQRVSLTVEVVQGIVCFILAAALLFGNSGRWANAGLVLLLVYWALNIPRLGQELSLIARQYPSHRNVMLRLLELLTAPEEHAAEETPIETPSSDRAVAHGRCLVFSDVSVRAGGHTVLENVSLVVEPGSHVGIVGPSGAGKSTLVGLLLGWHTPASGAIRVDDTPLDGDALRRLRAETAWVDPSVQIWNSSLLSNLTYGVRESTRPLGRIIDESELHSVLRTLPQGLQSPLGEGGSLLSGGEGQRVRFARAMGRPDARLVVLDEPFRGLTRELRQVLFARARELWHRATLLCITHDIQQTRALDHVVVVERGRIVEQGPPAVLAAQPHSRYRQLLDAEDAVRSGLWSNALWRRFSVDEGHVRAAAAGQ